MSETPESAAGLVIDVIDCGLVVVNTDCRIDVWNDWIASASGIPACEALGKPAEDIFGDADSNALMRAIVTALETGAGRILTHSLHQNLIPLRSRSGRPIIFDTYLHLIQTGAQCACVVQLRDVTSQVERDHVLRMRLAASYDAVMEAAPDAVLTLDSDALIQFANPAAIREFGYGREELIGKPLQALIGESACWQAAWPPILSGEMWRRPIEASIRRKVGTLFFAEISGSRWLSAGHVFVTIIVRDVTERRAAEHALRELNQTLERRVAARTAERDRMWRLSSDLMMVTSLDGTIKSVNPAGLRLLGGEQEDIAGKNIRDVIAAMDLVILEAALEELARLSGPKLFETGIMQAPGCVRRVAWSAVAENGLLYAVGRDVTEEREKDLALRTTEEQLRQSQKLEAIGQLTGGIAHDFNNLLTGIIGAMNIIQRRIAAGSFSDVQQFIEAAVLSANRAAALTHRLLAFARRQPLTPKPLDVNQLIRGMDDLLRRSLGEQIVIETDLAEGSWPIFCDGNQLENALLNLAVNARDAMRDGGTLTISTANRRLAAPYRSGDDEIAPGDYTVIAVCDTGEGIPADALPKVFEPFFTTKPVGEGTGLGLSMVYGFARQSGGNVQIDTAVGEGTTVRLFLPRYRGGVDHPATNGLTAAPAGAGESVLVVEDDTSVRLVISEVLLDLGYSCLQAPDADSALSILKSDGPVDLLISDIGLPGVNGRQLVEIARRHRPELKVLFVTGYTGPTPGQNIQLDRATQMLTKPFVPDVLASKIRMLIAA